MNKSTFLFYNFFIKRKYTRYFKGYSTLTIRIDFNISKNSNLFFLPLLIFFLSNYSQVYSQNCMNFNHPDYNALIELYDSTGGEDWFNKDGWQEGAAGESCDPCNWNGRTWYGLECNNGRVICIDLDGFVNCKAGENNTLGNNLIGTLPNLSMSELIQLDLGFNSLEGSIPNFNALPKLERLNIWRNQLVGEVPDFSLPSLKRLDLGYNNFSGAIPNFSGMPNLEHIDMPGNNISSIPNFDRILKLEYIGFFSNNIEGPLPSFSALPNLRTIEFTNNNFSGDIPSYYKRFCCLNAGFVNLFNNPNLPREGDFDAFCQENVLSCAEQPCRSRDSLILISLYGNTSGATWAEPRWDTTQSMETWNGIILNEEGCVIEIVLENKLLSGILPEELGQLEALKRLNLGSNRLVGEVPLSLGNLDNLEELKLNNNGLTMSIPPTLGNLDKLRALDLHGNQLSGPIPPELGDLINLEQFYLNTNKLSGCYPDKIKVHCNLGFSTDESQKGFNLSDNNELPWKGDFEIFCMLPNNTSMVGATCDDGDFQTLNDSIDVDCNCLGSICPTGEINGFTIGEDIITCEEEVSISINLPNGYSGYWSTDSEAKILIPEDSATIVYDLPLGQSIFKWTLLIDDCDDINSKELKVTRLNTEIRAGSDIFDIDSEEKTLINVVENDEINDEFTIRTLSSPTKGIIENLQNGTFYYKPNNLNTSSDRFDYEICVDGCILEVCSETDVIINIKGESFSDEKTITPNNDGYNDFLVFENLTLDKYPNNKIIIFGRYEDIIYKANPYLNNWGGIYKGKLVPDGAYFFILSLNDGAEKIKGYITVMTK